MFILVGALIAGRESFRGQVKQPREETQGAIRQDFPSADRFILTEAPRLSQRHMSSLGASVSASFFSLPNAAFSSFIMCALPKTLW
ncbi:MAG: hypothetical protein ACLR5G_05335 [Eubacteriales bacterium]